MAKKTLSGKYDLVLGLEIHMHVKTEHKMFCSCSTEGIYDAQPNTHVCPVCLGLPGALPVPNSDAVEKTQKLGVALNCDINSFSRFDRKHYFYPDLPKGYQISQYKQPFCEGGYLDLPSGARVELERIHLEEDTAKSFHEGADTLIDFNKSGMALIEMVTRPTIYSVEVAVEYCREIREIVRYLGISDADMEKGQLRIEPNISLRSKEMTNTNRLPNYKVEVKNINSFRFMEKAVKAEIVRQKELLDQGINPKQENRGYDETTGKTYAQRSKEEAHDYRYFPEPDIPPFEFSSNYLENLRKELQPLPLQIKKNLQKDYGITFRQADILFTEDLVDLVTKMKDLDANLDEVVNKLVNRPEYRKMSPKEFKEALDKEKEKVSDVSELEPIFKKVLSENEKVIDQILEGKDSAVEYLVGIFMRETRGKADPEIVRKELKKRIHSE